MYDYISKIKNNEISFEKFIKKRFLRLIPMLFFGAILYEIIIIIYIEICKEPFLNNIPINNIPSLWGTVINSLGIQNSWGLYDYMINNPTWYCSILLIMYIIFFIAVKFSDKHNISPNVTFIFLIILGLSINTYDINLPFLSSNTARGYYSFFTGLILASYLNNKKSDFKSTIFSSIFIIIFTLLFAYRRSYLNDGFIYIITFMLYPAIITLLNNKCIKNLFRFKIIGTISEISFNVFIIHTSLIILLMYLPNLFGFTIDFSNIKYMYMFVIICFIFATIILYTYEKPIKKYVQKNVSL